MDLKKEIKDIIKYGQGSKERKKKIINMALLVIQLMNSDQKNISDNDLDKLYGGICYTGCSQAEFPTD